MTRVLAIVLLVLVLGGCQFLEGARPAATDPLPPATTPVPRLSPTIEIPPPIY